MLHQRYKCGKDEAVRADRFVERWNRYSRAAERAYVEGDYDKRRTYQVSVRLITTSLERDPQVQSILANRKRELGIFIDSGRRLGAELAFNHGIDLGSRRGLGIGM